MSLPVTFPEFFEALWGHAPFPWQARLAEQTASQGWPEWITLPTGTGKTSVIDIAVYALAAQANRRACERTAPVRIVFAVNRRIVVDEAFDRARTIAQRLRDSLNEPESPLRRVSEALLALADDPEAPPLEAYPLRGGTFTDRSWARSPFQPLVLSTTLDQLGSRLLFRGYGVSEFARPIHAALLANDALILLDEAHTAKAFSQTLEGLARLRLQATEPLNLPFHAVQLTATPPTDAVSPFTLDTADRSHPVIQRRLKATKPCELISVPGATGTARHKRLAECIRTKALNCLDEGHRRVLIVVNRVATAEALREMLTPTRKRPEHTAAVELLTGRLRPLDRDALVTRLARVHQLKSATPAADVPPLILVSTQAIEVGADFDFDALLTELAPLDSLRQRFGRLNRYGRDRVSPAAIFAPEDSLAEPSPGDLVSETNAVLDQGHVICVRTWANQDAARIGHELARTRNKGAEGQAKPCWFSDITESKLQALLKSGDPSAILDNFVSSEADLGKFQGDCHVVLMCVTDAKKAKSPPYKELRAPARLHELLENDVAPPETRAEHLAAFAASVSKAAGKDPLVVVAIPASYDADEFRAALLNQLYPRPIDIEVFNEPGAEAAIRGLTSQDEVGRIRADYTAARRVVVIARESNAVATPFADYNLGEIRDPLYGSALPEVWAWLHRQVNLDFGLDSLDEHLPSGADLLHLLAPSEEAPILLAPHVDLLSQTSPEPMVSPEPSLYIHGPRREFPEVGIVIRDDLHGMADPLEALKLVPPLGSEAATVPLHLARRWMADPIKVKDESGDAPGESTPGSDRQPDTAMTYIVWRKGEPVVVNNPAQLQPGDVLVLGASDPDALENLLPVATDASGRLDQFEAAYLLARDRLAIRFHEVERDRLAGLLPDSASKARFEELVAPLFAITEGEDGWTCDESAWREAIPGIAAFLARALPEETALARIWHHAACLGGDSGRPRPATDWRVIRFPHNTINGALISNRSRVGAGPWPLEPDELGRQGNSSPRAVALNEHTRGVVTRGRRNARLLPPPLQECVVQAARWHDLGKVDPRFQALLHGCPLHAVGGREPTAKSNRPFNPTANRLMAEALLLPEGFRHELLSAVIVARHMDPEDLPEPDLLVHLIASHHGRCRCFAPVIADSNSEPFEIVAEGIELTYPGYSAPMAHLSDGVPGRFWELTRRFGWWGLAYLETLLRLADQAESANPTQQDDL